MVLTKSELEIMDAFWATDVPMSRSDLLELPCEKTWKDSSVHILLNGLLKKGAIREVGFVKRSKTFGRTFRPTMTREEYFASMIFSFRNKPKIVGLMEALLRRQEITADELDAIEKLVAARKA